MLYYRLYFLSARTGHIMRFAEYEAPDDSSAMALAREQAGEQALELWCRHRKVGRLERSPASSSAGISHATPMPDRPNAAAAGGRW